MRAGRSCSRRVTSRPAALPASAPSASSTPRPPAESSKIRTCAAGSSFARAYIAYFRGNWRKAFEGAEQADALFSANCANVVWERDTVHALSHWAQVYLGSLKTLGQMLPARLHEAELQGNLYAVWALPASISVLHWIARDDVAGGRAAVVPISERWSLRGYRIQHWNEMASNALLDLYAGDVRGRAGASRRAGCRCRSRS